MASPVLRTVSSYDCVKCFRVPWEDGDLEPNLQQFLLIKAWLATDPLSLSLRCLSYLLSSVTSEALIPLPPFMAALFLALAVQGSAASE